MQGRSRAGAGPVQGRSSSGVAGALMQPWSEGSAKEVGTKLIRSEVLAPQPRFRGEPSTRYGKATSWRTNEVRRAGPVVLDLQPRRYPGVACTGLVRQFSFHSHHCSRTKGAPTRQPRPTAWGLGQPTFLCPERATHARVLPFQGASVCDWTGFLGRCPRLTSPGTFGARQTRHAPHANACHHCRRHC
jgi:hypothetical protein